MKTFTLLAGLLLATSGSFAQNFVLLENQTSCDVFITIVTKNTASCMQTSPAASFVVPANTTVPATAPAGEDWIHCEIISWPWGCPWGIALDTDFSSGCLACPGFGAPSSGSVSTGGCNGCASSLNMVWKVDCFSSPVTGYIYIY